MRHCNQGMSRYRGAGGGPRQNGKAVNLFCMPLAYGKRKSTAQSAKSSTAASGMILGVLVAFAYVCYAILSSALRVFVVAVRCDGFRHTIVPYR